MKDVLQGIFWISIYLVLSLTPLFVLLVGPAPQGQGFWWDFSMALGFASTAMMGVMFVLTARFRRAAAPFGIDLIYYFHRQISLVLFGFALAHPVILLGMEPQLIALLHPINGSWYMLAGLGSLLIIAVILTTSLWRKQLGIHYDGWRLWHTLFSVIAFVLAIVHIEGVGHYIAAPWKRPLWTVITASWLTLIVYVRLIKPACTLRKPFRITEVTKELGDSWTLVFQPDGHRGFSFQPGQFVWLSLWNSPFALKEHPFSISSSAEYPRKIHLTIKELGDFTGRIKYASVGQTAFLDGPYGAFSCDRRPSPGYVFVAGGIGIAPIMSMLRTLADREDSRPLLLIYAYNTWERLTFREELELLKGRLNLNVVYILKEPPENWGGEVGMISEDLLGRHLPEDRSCRDYFICGPVPMTELTEKALVKLKVPLRKIHSELFDLV